MINLRDLGADRPTGVLYNEEQILVMVRKGKQRGHIPGIGRVVARKGKTAIFADQPRGTYTDAGMDAKLASRQLGSHSEIGGVSGSGSGGGGDDQSGGNKDAGGDDDI
ncbi:hypothetical protein Tco_0808151 [Tanacetum coccineum]